MSETDDTDELLLIPPDFFIINSETELKALDNFDPFYSVVESLISQVNNLENRVNFLQQSSEISFACSSLDQSFDLYNMHDPGFRKCGSSEDLLYERELYSESTQSTPQKPRTKFALHSLPNSPHNDRFNPRRRRNSPQKWEFKKPDIDTFVSTVKSIKRLSAARNLEHEFDKPDKKLNITGMLKQLELKQMHENSVQNIEKPIIKEKVTECGDNIGSVPDLGFGMRDFLYSEKNANEEAITKTANLNSNQSTNCEPSINIEKSSSSSSESTQATALHRFAYGDHVTSNALNALNKHRGVLHEEDVAEKSKHYRTNAETALNVELVSLSNLWKDDTDLAGIPLKFKQKMYEEKLRRQHCEQLIQKLQNRTLELQERLAVAVQVDDTKDTAILQFHEAWEKASAKLQTLNNEKGHLEEEIKINQQKNIRSLEEAAEKISHYENESSKALSLAHNCQEKVVYLEMRCTELQNDLHNFESKLDEVQLKYHNEAEKNKKYPEIIAQKEIELNECRNLLNGARREVGQSKKAVEMCQIEMSSMKTENVNLQQQLSHEKTIVEELNEQKNKLIQEIEARKNVEKSIQDELNKTRLQLENNKVELKNFYQGQVELVVQTKLKEFQNQLNQVENDLREDLRKKELSIAKKAASHIQQISEKNDLEIKLLEQKQQEEISLYHVKLAKYQQEMEDMKAKMQCEQEKNNHFYRQVSKFVDSVKQEQHFSTVEQLNSFRSKSYSNLEEIILSIPGDERRKVYDEGDQDSDRNSQLTYKIPIDISTHNKMQKNKQQKDGELRNLIDLLLDKPSGNPMGDGFNNEKWQIPSIDNNQQTHKLTQKEKRHEKRPWK